MNRLYELNDEVNNFYEEFNFNKVYQIVLNFCNSELSSFFFDVRKDSLYCNSPKSQIVKSTKSVMIIIFEFLIRWLSPLIPFTMEEAWQCWRKEINTNAEESCHLLNRKE